MKNLTKEQKARLDYLREKNFGETALELCQYLIFQSVPGCSYDVNYLPLETCDRHDANLFFDKLSSLAFRNGVNFSKCSYGDWLNDTRVATPEDIEDAGEDDFYLNLDWIKAFYKAYSYYVRNKDKGYIFAIYGTATDRPEVYYFSNKKELQDFLVNDTEYLDTDF